VKWIMIVFMAIVLSGCSGVIESVVDPAGYTQRQTAQAEAKRSDAEAQRAFAESQSALAESEAERSRSEAQRAQAEAQAAASRSTADQATAAAFAKLGEAIKEAGQPNNSPVIVAMLLIACIAGWVVWNSRQVTVQTIAASRPPVLAPPPAVKLLAEQQGLNAVHDGQRWLLVDEQGTVVQRQRLIAGNQ